MPDQSRPDDVRIDSTLQKGLRILEALAASPTPRGVTELARELELTKSNTFRLLQSLSALGYVRSVEGRKYAVAMKLWRVSQSVVDNLNLKEIAADQMQRLSRQTGETIYLAVPDGLSVVYIDKIDSTKPIRSWNQIGGVAPLHCVGTGKAVLAARYGHLRESIRGHLTRFTDRTITSIARLDEEMVETRRRGFAIDCGEYRENIYSFGSAVSLPNGDVVAALGVSVPDVNLDDARKALICEQLLEAAGIVTRRLADL